MNLQEIFNWYRSFNPGVTYDGMNQRLNQLEKDLAKAQNGRRLR